MNRLGLLLLLFAGTAGAQTYPEVRPGYTLQFPRDHGSHPAYRTEWWYVTGWLTDASGRETGFQITFFRNRPGVQEDNPSAFAPKQLLFAHAAIADPAAGRLRHDQRAARAGFGLAQAAETDTDVNIDAWSLRRTSEGYVASIPAREFDLALRFRPTQPVLLQGRAGVSRKGGQAKQASYYYSVPHLAVSGTVTVEGRARAVSGQAWLDHEWSSEYLAPQAQGWDWLGVNLSDGGALMAFRMRTENGETHWAGGTYRSAAGRLTVFPPSGVKFTVLRKWRSPRTRIEYPVAMKIEAGPLSLTLDPLMEDQELDARASTGNIYWEGAVRAKRDGRTVGSGYLELTGYGQRLNF